MGDIGSAWLPVCHLRNLSKVLPGFIAGILGVKRTINIRHFCMVKCIALGHCVQCEGVHSQTKCTASTAVSRPVNETAMVVEAVPQDGVLEHWGCILLGITIFCMRRLVGMWTLRSTSPILTPFYSGHVCVDTYTTLLIGTELLIRYMQSGQRDSVKDYPDLIMRFH